MGDVQLESEVTEDERKNLNKEFIMEESEKEPGPEMNTEYPVLAKYLAGQKKVGTS